MSEQSSPPAATSFQRYHVLSSDEDEFEDHGNVVLTSPSYELGGLVSNASMHSTGGQSASSSPDRLPPQQQQQQQFPSRNNPVKSFEEVRSVASSNKSVASGVSGSRSLRTSNSASLPNSPLNSLTKSAASHDDSDDEEEDNGGPGGNSREVRGDGGGGIGKMSWNDDDDVDDDLSDDDDEAGLRRYHFTQANTLPAEFDNASTWKRITTYLLEVRMAARQRRAHRLLSMSGTHMDSPAQRCRLCFMTHCWDATDRGILLLIVSVFAWLVVGFVLHLGERWWYAGLALLLVRVLARPTYDSLFVRRQPFAMSTSAAISARASSSAAAGGFGRIPSSGASTAESLELGGSSHHRALGRPVRSRSPSPKPRGMV